MNQPANSSVPENRLLSALPREDSERFRADLEPVRPAMKESFYEPDQPIEYVYFPRSGVVSLITVMADGAQVEVGTVGSEGLVGLPVVLGATMMPGRAVMQIPGEMARLSADRLRQEMERSGTLRALLLRYAQSVMNQLAQSAACNRLHKIEERCARWLLTTHDRVHADTFLLTQEFLSQMLGVRRPTVNVAARVLQRAGLIRYRRGRITIVDRAGLESVSCECYRTVRAELDRLLGPAPGGEG